MFMWPQNGGSMSTESSELSGEGFLQSYNFRENMKTNNGGAYSFQVSFDDSRRFKAAFRT